jgi:hypothetical protein
MEQAIINTQEAFYRLIITLSHSSSTPTPIVEEKEREN